VILLKHRRKPASGPDGTPVERKHWVDYAALVISIAAFITALWPLLTVRFDVRAFVASNSAQSTVLLSNPGAETALITEINLYWGSEDSPEVRGQSLPADEFAPFVLKPSEALHRSISLETPLRMLKQARGLEPYPRPEGDGPFLRSIPPRHIVKFAEKGEWWSIFLVVVAKNLKGDEYEAEFKIDIQTDEKGEIDARAESAATKELKPREPPS
jgi:hypothetical protein